MSNFYLAKHAALEQLADLFDQDENFDLEDLMAVLRDTLQAPLAKTASEDDRDYKLGLEGLCYEILEKVAEYHATMVVNNSREAGWDVLCDVIEKNAAEHLSADKVKDMVGELPAHYNEKRPAEKQRFGEQTAGNIGRHIQDKAQQASKFLEEAYAKHKKPMIAGAAGVGALGLGAAGYGAYKALKNRNKKKDEDK